MGDLDIKSRNNVLYIGAFDGQKATINVNGIHLSHSPVMRFLHQANK